MIRMNSGFRRNDGGTGTACCAPTALDSRPVSGYGTCFRENDGEEGWIPAFAGMTEGRRE